LFAAAGVAAAVTAVHWPVLRAQAISFDDTQYLLESELIQHPSAASAWRLLTEVLTPTSLDGYYEPLSQISLMLDVAAGGREGNLRPFHRTNLALHAFNCGLLVLLLYMIFRRVWPAVVAGLLFGLHPLTVEPVAWVWERKTPLATFFVLLCLLLYVAYVRRRAPRDNAIVHVNGRGRAGTPSGKVGLQSRLGSGMLYAGALLAFMLALLSKPTSVPLPVMLLALDYWPLRRLSLRAVLEKIPFFALSAAAATVTILSTHHTAKVFLPETHSVLQTPLRICYVLGFYLWKMVWPVDLSSVYMPPEPLTLANPKVLLAVGVVVLIVALLAVSLRWTRAPLAAAAFFVVGLSPTLGVIGYTWVMASDKYVYLPAIGIAIALGAAVAWVSSSVRMGRGRRAGLLVAVFVLAVLEAVGVRHNLCHWQDTRGLIAYMLRLAPNHPRLNNEMGVILEAEGRSTEALPYAQRAVELKPDYPLGHYNLGNVLYHLERIPEAETHFREAARLSPTFGDAVDNVGVCELAAGRIDDAMASFVEAVRLRPMNAEAHQNLAYVLLIKGRVREAAEQYQLCLRLEPKNVQAQAGLREALRQINASQPAGR
jgi:protein O-mannosyl-transferase